MSGDEGSRPIGAAISDERGAVLAGTNAGHRLQRMAMRTVEGSAMRKPERGRLLVEKA